MYDTCTKPSSYYTRASAKPLQCQEAIHAGNSSSTSGLRLVLGSVLAFPFLVYVGVCRLHQFCFIFGKMLIFTDTISGCLCFDGAFAFAGPASLFHLSKLQILGK